MTGLAKKVFQFFRRVSAIPRQSGNEQGIQDYLVNFAQTHNLPFYQDEYHNVIIYKKTVDKEPIILQAHTDIVYVKKTSYNPKQRKGIRIVKGEQWMWAKDTSLGADDGIGVALILAILDSNIPCNIEALFTASEETTMRGAYKVDVSKLTAKKLICLDGFENNTMVVSSASFTDFLVKFNNQTHKFSDQNYYYYNMGFRGLLGGHSGFDIDKGNGNSHQLVVEFLHRLPDVIVERFIGGHEYNVIPTDTSVIFATTADDEIIDKTVQEFIDDHIGLSPLLTITTLPINPPLYALDHGEDLINFLSEFKYDVLKKDEDGNVIVSQNLSEVNSDKGFMKIGLRSNLKSDEPEMLGNLQALCEKYHFDWEIVDSQPAFATLPNSTLLADLQRANPAAKKAKMHIAVECGIFQDRIKDLDTVIISPTIYYPHSIQEKLKMDTVENTAKWLKAFLTQN